MLRHRSSGIAGFIGFAALGLYGSGSPGFLWCRNSALSGLYRLCERAGSGVTVWSFTTGRQLGFKISRGISNDYGMAGAWQFKRTGARSFRKDFVGFMSSMLRDVGCRET